ncbi:MAG TPA: hypothetical protein VL547_14025 [Dinghuibacter sp.]|uniref:tetratricopeptide repeat protein n=1 Tax=Dinghuibacter sp. TaxID=2024697 RepID=UPI002B9A1847|nr:hypothetical protein [Dinghuibacter sp.]HTJ13147.1 hypothetical protein [Dinghuibacter sp.]
MRIPLLLISVCLLAACGRHERAVVPVTPFTIYDIDAVRAALAGPHDVQWDKKLGDAVGLSRSKRRYDEAADSIKSVIYHVATPKAYFELGTALLMGKRYEEAVQALGIAEKLQYAPLYNVLYELSAAYAQNGDKYRDTSLKYMQVAIQMGIPDPTVFIKDPAFAPVRVYYDFKDTYRIAMDGRRDRAASLWADFLAGFPSARFPLAIDSQWFTQHPHKSEDDIDYSYEKYITEMRAVHFARGEEPGYFSVGKVHADSVYIALVYGGSDDWGEYTDRDPDDTAVIDNPMTSQVFFYLTTYTPQGKIIDKMLVAGRNSVEDSSKSFSIGPTMEFAVADTVKRLFRIDPTGKIQPSTGAM